MAPRLLVALVLLATTPALVWAQPRETPLGEGRRTLSVQGERYGTLGEDHAITLRVRRIFQKIVRAAGRRPGAALEVHVLDTPRLVAESLRGGLVVLSRGFVDLTRGDDHALAFWLAHEAAHLVRDHHALLDSLGVLGAGVTPGRPPAPEVVRAYHAIELDADRLGVLFAALAGYDVAAAVPTLVVLTERAGPDLFHPEAKLRASTIRDQIAEVRDHLEVFHLGLFLLGTGRYLDSARVLEHFLSLFPGREVLSTAGVAYHKEALRQVPPPEFRHLLVVDAATRAPTARGTAAPPAFRRNLERAVHYYTLAVDADPAYAPALVNLAAAYLDLGERDLALGHVNRALREEPGLASAHNNRALAWLQARDYAQAERDLLTAARLEPRLREVSHNLARLYEREGKADEARRWAARAQPAAATEREAPADGLTGLVPGMPLSRFTALVGEPGVRELRVPLGGGPGRDLALHVASRQGLAVVSRNQVVEAVALLPAARTSTAQGLRPGDPASKVEATWGRAPGRDGIQALNVWGYPARGAAVLLADDRVQAIWLGQAPRREP